MSEWQPIETAPHDGTEIIIRCNIYPVFSAGMETTGKLFRARMAIYSTWDGCFRLVEGGELLDGLVGHKPTHWLSIPEAPE